jgi:putative endonuclease
MSFYVYIIQSLKDGSYYKGFTEEPVMRLQRHNNGESNYTRTKMPWKYVYIEQLSSKRDGLIREKILKKYSHEQIKQLIASDKNSLKNISGSSVG